MTDRPTMVDVARAAGVGVATVDRVLNGRRKVRDENARRVFEAAMAIGYHAAPVIRYRLAKDAPAATFGFIFPKERQSFYQELSQELASAVERCPGIRGQIIIRHASSQSPEEYADLLRTMAGKADVVAASAVEARDVTAAVASLSDSRIPTFAFLNDFAIEYRRCFVGLDNIKVGRTAGWMLAGIARAPGTIAILIGGHRWQAHQQRELGLRSYFRDCAPEFHLRDAIPNLETRQLTYEMTVDLLNRFPDLRGIYIAGGGMEGAIAALREAREPGEVPLVVHPLTAESRAGLIDRYVTMVISTPVRTLCDRLVQLMKNATLGTSQDIADKHFLQPDLFLPESF
ncbi:MAG: LacI family DNA-binding transcriptional regulator [Hyphomicrobiaceae bacterium]